MQLPLGYVILYLSSTPRDQDRPLVDRGERVGGHGHDEDDSDGLHHGGRFQSEIY